MSARLLDGIQAAAPQAEVTAVYGSTEAEPIACLFRRNLRPADRAAMDAGAGLLAGRPVAAARLRVLPDRWGTPIGPFGEPEFDTLCLGPGQAGEIVVTGPHVLPGYLHGEGDRETKFRVGGVVWHRTGDAGRVDADGNLWLLGRCAVRICDRQGVLYPFTVETAAGSLAAVRRSAFVRAGGRRTLVVEPAAGSTSAELDLLQSKLSWAKIERVLLLPRIPVDRVRQWGSKSWLGLPILANNQVVALGWLTTTDDHYAFGQDEIDRALAAALAVGIDTDRLRAATHTPLESPETYDSGLRGEAHRRSGTPESLMEAGPPV